MNGIGAAEALEDQLGDPYETTNPYGFAAAVARDERDEFPEQLCAALHAAKFHLNYLPVACGGEFRSFEDSLTLVQTAARRDLNVMPGTMFGITAATCLLLHGSDAQREQVFGILRRGGAVAFALSEADHGSDLLANATRLVPDTATGGWQLSGTKWMVGRGLTCDAIYVVARTGERGPGAFSAVLIDPNASSDRLTSDPAVRTAGMRGIDFAHLRLDDLPVPADALVGTEGEAVEIAVKAQQVVRVLSMAGSLGCADTALRLTLDFASTRRVGRKLLTDTAFPRRELAIASAAMVAASAVALAAARGLHHVPEVLSVWGCAAKHVVAEAADDLIRRCGTVLATRSVLRSEGPGDGLFQKLQRDAAIVRVIDTSTIANLRSFTGQLPALAAAPGSDADLVRAIFDLSSPLPPYEPERLDLIARGNDPVIAALEAVTESVRRTLTNRGDAGTAALAGELTDRVGRLRADVQTIGHGDALADLAERYSWLHAAACCLHLWWANPRRQLFGTEPGSASWLGACLGYLLARADGVDPRRDAGPLGPALDVTLGLHRANQLFSAHPVQLAGKHGGSDAQG
ncbi:acyl-CoA dehydrogenase family protein [Kribbella sp. NPDC050124]|uniref:acyl-CoA dehydrogenase family protein n=1 Tax=Kribbella sp. NPDC050124 TaxID=3364114 RepID=UPI00379B9E21